MTVLPPARRAVSTPAEVRAFLVEAAGRGYGCVVLHPREYGMLDIALADGMIGSLGGIRVMREPFAVKGWAVTLPVDGGEVWPVNPVMGLSKTKYDPSFVDDLVVFVEGQGFTTMGKIRAAGWREEGDGR